MAVETMVEAVGDNMAEADMVEADMVEADMVEADMVEVEAEDDQVGTTVMEEMAETVI